VAVSGHDGRGLRLRDGLGPHEACVRSRHVVNAAGPHVDALRAACGIDAGPLVRTTRGSHLVLPPRAGELGLAAFLPDRRIQFVLPHDDGTLCGTTDVDDALPGDEGPPPAADVQYLLDALAFVLATPPQRADVRFAYAGWRALPAVAGPAGALHREAFVVAEPLADATLHSVVGGKLTTHRSFAERVVAAIFGLRDPSPTRTRALPGGDGPREVRDPLWWRHGGEVVALRARLPAQPELAQPLCPHRPFLRVELAHALEHEGAVTFADAMLRRLVHSQGPCRERACLRAAHGWPVDDDASPAIDALLAEVQALAGEFAGVAPHEARP
jgi:glycerol-3-phosphate dehydrogenase